ncbi:MAG: hypothetical protein J5I93_15255, partial [Pirellulaceae bacterium]|nr:hypothetical protein [Pirellulaceae bacterium]
PQPDSAQVAAAQPLAAQPASAPLESVPGAWPVARRLLLVAGLLAVAAGATRLLLQRSPTNR